MFGLFSKKKQVNKELHGYDFPDWNGYNVFIPMIVVDSNLFQYDIVSEKITEVDFLYYRTSGIGEAEESCVVEILKKEKLDEYLLQLNNTIEQIRKSIEVYEPRNPDIA